jgi:hypothetical protein
MDKQKLMLKNYLLRKREKTEDAITHNHKPTWVKQKKQDHENLTPDPWTVFTVYEIIEVIK